MKELVAFMARELVDHPEAVVVRETGSRGHVRLALSVAESDIGKVIGRQGRVAQAMRSLVKVAAAREGVRVTLDIA